MAHPHEEAINDWMKSFEALPADRKDNLYRWFATQKVIMEASGLKTDEWFGYIQWAMDNPFDYSFIHDFPEVAESAVGDAAERSDATRSARQLVGGTVKVAAPDGKGMKEKATSNQALERELFKNFMKGRRG